MYNNGPTPFKTKLFKVKYVLFLMFSLKRCFCTQDTFVRFGVDKQKDSSFETPKQKCYHIKKKNKEEKLDTYLENGFLL